MGMYNIVTMSTVVFLKVVKRRGISVVSLSRKDLLTAVRWKFIVVNNEVPLVIYEDTLEHLNIGSFSIVRSLRKGPCRFGKIPFIKSFKTALCIQLGYLV